MECFPSDATVEVLDVGKVQLSSLKIGQQVRVIDDKNQISYSPIIAFLHRELDEQATYKRIRTKNTVIELSARHLIERQNDGFVWAEKLEKGDKILVLSSKHANKTNWEEIIDINEVDKQGLMAPLTEQGTIIVNNVHTSCYAIVKSHTIAHFALSPYRLYRRLFGRSSDNNIAPILTYANILFQLFKNLPIAKDFIF
jgi:hedgehog protein